MQFKVTIKNEKFLSKDFLGVEILLENKKKIHFRTEIIDSLKKILKKSSSSITYSDCINYDSLKIDKNLDFEDYKLVSKTVERLANSIAIELREDIDKFIEDITDQTNQDGFISFYNLYL